MTGIIGELTEDVPIVHPQSLNEEIQDLFKKYPQCSGIVIVEEQIPVGLITRMNFFQKLGTLYGYNLYIKKPIKQLMNRDILVVDYSTSIIDVSRMAMERKEEELYDYVIITKNGVFEGVVSISRLLMKFAEVQAEIASYLNPLTGLPGNRLIEDKLADLYKKDKYSILYIDVDNFKTYNDVYGFAKGDQVIQSIANLIKKYVNEYNGFLGHIGGDDFLAGFDHYVYEKCCELIFKEFELLKHTFYYSKHVKQNYVFTEDRSGMKRRIPLITLSIGVVTNKHLRYESIEEIIDEATRLKKLCKQQEGNVYIDSLHVI